jgi:hypothetical protein
MAANMIPAAVASRKTRRPHQLSAALFLSRGTGDALTGDAPS